MRSSTPTSVVRTISNATRSSSLRHAWLSKMSPSLILNKQSNSYKRPMTTSKKKTPSSEPQSRSSKAKTLILRGNSPPREKVTNSWPRCTHNCKRSMMSTRRNLSWRSMKSQLSSTLPCHVVRNSSNRMLRSQENSRMQWARTSTCWTHSMRREPIWGRRSKTCMQSHMRPISKWMNYSRRSREMQQMLRVT